MAITPNVAGTQQSVQNQVPGEAGTENLNQNKADGEDNSKNQLLTTGNIWEDKPKEGSDKSTNNQNANNQNANNEDQTRQNNLKQYVESLFNAELPADVQEKIKNGDFSALGEHNKKLAEDIYTKSISDASRMMNAFGKRLEAQMEAKFRGMMGADKASSSLLEALPFASNPNIKPIAEAVKAKFLSQGLDDSAANAKTKAFFTEFATFAAGDLGLDAAPKNQPGSGGYNNGRPSEPTRVEDWSAILGVPASTNK